MKKSIFVMLALVLALGALGVGVAFAQTEEPPVAETPVAPFGHGMMRENAGVLRTYKVEAFAAKFGLSVDEVTALLDGGARLHEIALDNGVAEADLPALMQELHQTALDAAVADGVLTQEQADLMADRMQSRGFADGTCDHDGVRPMDGSGFGGGGHGMGGGRGNRGAQNQQP